MSKRVLQKITLEELKKHNEKSDTQWVAIHGYVYDITNYKDEHPGGDDILLEYAGQDATREFEDNLHSDAARDQMRQYLIGVLSK